MDRPQSMDRTSQSISMQGSLDKQCKMRTWTWKNYWFVLKDNHLTYFKEGSRRSSVLIDLAHAHCIRNTTKGPVNGYAFEVVTKSRTHVLSSPDDDNRSKWVDKLRRAMMCKRSSSSLSSSSISSASSINKQNAFSTPSCNSISDDEETMTYENASESSSSIQGEDEVFYSLPNNNKTKDFDKMPPKIPQGEKTPHKIPSLSDPPYSLPFDAYSSDKKKTNGIKDTNNGTFDHDYDYISNGFGIVQEGENPYCEVQDSISTNPGSQKVQMRKSLDNSKPMVRRLVGSKTTDSNASCGTEPGYASIRDQQRSPEYYKPPVELFSSDTSTLGESDKSDRLSTLTLVAAQATEVKDSTTDLRYEPIPNLLYPRIELTFGGAFDEIRRFIANNRGPAEMYAMPNKYAATGKSIKKLKDYLAELEGKSCIKL